MAKGRLQSPRLADLVAGVLRERILSGQLKDGETLARQEDLLEEFSVSPPSMREALRILESEGLITVLRGNVGGAVVHAAPVHTAAYTMAMVLQARNADLADVGMALQGLEPLCASMCAARVDRADSVVLTLRAIHDETLAAAHDIPLVSAHARHFHEAIVDGCGSDTMIVLVGALEIVWSVHAAALAEMAVTSGQPKDRDDLFSPEALGSYARDHERLIEAIERGDSAEAAGAAKEHLRVAAAAPSSSGQQIRASLVRDGVRYGNESTPRRRTI